MEVKKKINKDYMLRVRMTEETLSKLDKITEKENKGRSEIVRELIEKEFKKLI